MARLNVPIDPDLYQAFKMETVKRKIKMATIIREFIKKYLEDNNGN